MSILLIIGHTLPEPNTTAAGRRMMQLIQLFQDFGYDITYASTAGTSAHAADLDKLNIKTVSITLNCNSFNQFIKSLSPEVVVFDRFMTEEQFGWRVAEECPTALKVLDTEDLHFLRKARHQAVKNGINIQDANLYTTDTKRELASILRCDLSLIISEVEIEILKTTFKISSSILHYLPLFGELHKGNNLSFDAREGFMTIGNHLHAPNKDSVLQLKNEIWPLIREKLPAASISIYGNYASSQILQLNNEKQGFQIKGWAPNIEEAFTTSRVCLAPLRFGAGLKGKIIDAMTFGTSVVSTSIGAEGINGNHSFCGIIADDPESFAAAAVELYNDQKSWTEAQNHGYEIIKSRFTMALFASSFKEVISGLCTTLTQHRQQNFVGQILQYESVQATKYMSKWIESKNRPK